MKRRRFVALSAVSVSTGCLRAQTGTGEGTGSGSESNAGGDGTAPAESGGGSDGLENGPGEPISTVELTKTWELNDEVFDVDQQRGSFFVDTLSSVARVETDGSVTWEVETPEDHSFELSSLVVGDDAIYVGTSYQGESDPHARLYAFDANGEELWFDSTASTGTRTRIKHVALGNEFVAYGSDTGGSDSDQDSVVRVLDRETGSEQWFAEFPEAFVFGLASTDERIAIATTEGLSLYERGGTRVREFDRRPSFRGMTSHGGVAYIDSQENATTTMNALDIRAGEFVWSEEISRLTEGGIAVSESALVFGDRSGTVVCLDPNSGGQFWESRVQSSLPDRIPPVLDGNRVWVSDDRGSVYALSLHDGTVVYEDRLSTEDPVSVAANDDVLLTAAGSTAYTVEET